MKVIINRVLPFGKKYHAINICGVVFAKGPCDAVTLNHEAIHTAQIKELFVIGFYLWYVLEWVLKALKYRNGYQGYRQISFEREAYSQSKNLNYLKTRKPFAFIYFQSP